MKAFDKRYALLAGMYRDAYFPDVLVDKVRTAVQAPIALLESGERNEGAIRAAFDEMTRTINDLQDEFEARGSELETAARESIAETVAYILDWFGIPIDAEDALREREW